MAKIPDAEYILGTLARIWAEQDNVKITRRGSNEEINNSSSDSNTHY